MNDKDIVSAVLALLADKLGNDRFELWFGPTTRLVWSENVLVVEAPNRFSQNWLRTHYRGAIETAIAEVLKTETAVEFRVNDSLASQRPKSTAARNGKKSASTKQLSAFDDSAATDDASTDTAESADADHSAPSTGSNGKTARRPAAVAHEDEPARPLRRRFATLDSFVTGPCNHFAHATAQMVAQRPGALTPLFIHGPTGCGKTHLLEGVLSYMRSVKRTANAVFLSAEQFTTYFLEALHGSGLPNFRRKYRFVELLIIDDLQFLVGKRATIVELLQTVDALARDHRQLVFSADRPPAELSELGPELTNRLSGGMVCRLEAPDLATRISLAQQFAKRLEMTLPAAAAEQIAELATGNAREISGAINRIHATSRILKRPVDLALVQEALADMYDASAGRVVRLADIERAVCDVFGLSKEYLQSARRAKHVSTARMLAMWLARKHTRAGLSEIGEYFGRRSHSTVISANRRVSDWIDKQSAIELPGDRCPAPDAVRRIELQIRAG